ncbi:MAG: gmhB [Nitrospira sp.]|jgi:D-glycero-D-manno-heptose 1,7-bisphosphate phosphatase|nr:gmhB [Nitrospira sp.]
MIPAVFLDKDGTLVEDEPMNVDTSRLRFYPDVFAALRLLQQAGFALVIVTNQGGVAHGRFSETDVREMRSYLERRLQDAGITLRGFYYCPHAPDGIIESYAIKCLCRKPQPGLLMQACGELRIDMSQSWMVGDILHDVEAGRWAGCRTILLNNGHETEWLLTESRWPDYIAETLLEAAQLITRSASHRPGHPTPERQEEER